MDNVTIAIYSADLDYSLALGEALSLQYGSFLVTVCEDKIGHEECAAYDLLLFDAERIDCADGEDGMPGAGSPLEGLRAGNVIYLVSSRSETLKDLDIPCFKLFKYANVKELASDIILYNSLLTGKVYMGIGKENFKMIAICGCMGGIGKTAVAMGIGQALCRYHGKRVLYLSMEEIESTLQYMRRREFGLSIGEYLYYLFKDGTKGPDQESFLLWDRHGIKAFNPDKGKNRLKELGAEQLSRFFNAVMGSGRYDYALIDLGEAFGEEEAWIIQRCDKVISVIKSGMAENERQQRFDTYLSFALGKKAESDLIRAHNMSRHGCGPHESGRNCVRIDYDPDSLKYEKGICDISIDQDFGIGIKELSKRIT